MWQAIGTASVKVLQSEPAGTGSRSGKSLKKLQKSVGWADIRSRQGIVVG